jgi:hypothetical protein
MNAARKILAWSSSNNRLQRTVIDKVPKVKRRRPAAEPGR